MIPAPVGFQCPDCVAAAAPAQRGGAVALTETARPTVSYTLVGICVVVYLTQLLLGDEVVANFAMRPVSIAFGQDFYRLVTAIFLHGSVLHLAFNMYVLFVLGPTLERILGHGRFLLLFLLAGVGGSAASYAFSEPTTWSVGASGAIFGLMGALLVAGQRLRYDVTMVLVLVVINIVIGFVFSSGIDWRAHLGGLATGAAIAAVMVTPQGKERRPAVEWGGVAAVALVIIAVVVWRTASLTAIGG